MLTTAVRARSERLVGPLWRPTVLGTLGSLGIVLFASRIGSTPRPPTYRWWLRFAAGNYDVAHVFFYLSVSLLLLGWLGVGVHALGGRLSPARAWAVLALWGGPLFLGTPVFSRDVYSYIAQGQLVRHGFNPYLVAPRALGPGPLLSSIASVWRDTTSPYGPLYVALSHVASALSSNSLIEQVLVFRTMELIGVALLMVALPALAGHFGADGGVAIWLGVLSPLALFSAVSSAHNDTLMLGLMAVALLLGVRGARRWAIVLFSLAATIKLPALAGVVFLSAGALRGTTSRERARLIVEAVAIPGLIITAVTELCGFGWTWLGPTALHIPTELRVLTTPMVSVGQLLASSLHALGLGVATSTAVTFTQHVGEVAAAVVMVLLVLHTRADNMARLFGVALMVIVIASPTVWPWYFLWGVTVLATTSAQRSLFLALVAALAMLLVGPGGTPMIGGNGFYVSGPLVLAGLVWFFWRGEWRTVLRGVDRVD